MNQIYKVIVLPDIHVPAHDEKSMGAVMRYMKDHKWDEVVLLGDFMDFDCISSHNKDNLRGVSGKTLEKDYIVGGELLDQLQAAASKAKFTLLEGNHCYRVERFIDANPQLEGRVEMELGLQLIKRKIKWVRYWSKGEVYRIGKATFIHGTYTNQYHAKKHVESYDASVFYGHVHSFQSHTKIQKKGQPRIGQSLGCLCELDQAYMRGRPSMWSHGFGVFYFREDGTFNHYPVMMVNHTFTSPEGKIYKG